MIPSYRNFIAYNKGLYAENRRMIEGVFRNSITKKVVKGDNFSCINIKNDAKKSYKLALEYFNYTREDNSETKRIFVSAKWSKKKLENDQTKV